MTKQKKNGSRTADQEYQNLFSNWFKKFYITRKQNKKDFRLVWRFTSIKSDYFFKKLI